MDTSAYRLGIWVNKATTAPRKLVDFRKSYYAYAEAAKVLCQNEAYLGAFKFDVLLQKHMKKNNGSTAGFTGPVYADYIPFDIDAENKLEEALQSARGLVSTLHYTLDVSEKALQVWFSGSKGFHVLIPTIGLAFSPSPLLPKQLKEMALHIAELAKVQVDTSIYECLRLFRAPNSMHSITGLYKVPLCIDELMHMDIAKIQLKAKEPIPADLYQIEELGLWCGDKLVEISKNAVDKILNQQKALKTTNSKYAKPRIMKSTHEYIKHGELLSDNRKMSLFKASANLAECGASLPLIYELLYFTAKSSGLDEKTVNKP